MREHSFELPANPRLVVSLAAGEIEVETQPGSEAFVRLSPLDDAEASLEAVERATVELNGSELLVKVKEKRLRFGSGGRVRAEIRCPEGIRAAFQTASGSIRTQGRLGDTKSHTASGNVGLDEVDGKLQVHSASGDVWAAFVRGDVEVHSASGALDLGRTEAGVEVRSASGNVGLADVGGGPIRLQSASGNVRVGVRAGRRVAVDVRTVSGHAQSDIPLDGSGGDDGDAPLVEIKVNGVSGDVRIERAAEPAALKA
jgi:hypothetical protein